ncbi:MAG: TonB-dependent receptor [Acidobacteriia bacterium]|nr:TonB-dependent receptor [Terriglobia bacterium]
MKDKTGAVVPKATVELSGPALIAPRTLTADDAGYVYFQQLPPGTYALAASAPSFRTYRVSGIQLDVGKLPTFDLALELGEVTQTIEVTSSAVLIDVTASNTATAVSEAVIENVPKGRSYQSLIPLAPGARQEPLQSSRVDHGRANGFQIDGASDSENSYMIEGLDTSDIQSGGVKQNVVFEFIQEVQIKTSGLAAEYGGAAGGVVNVIQKRGGNDWHGGLVVHYQTSALDSNDVCATTPQPSYENNTANTPSTSQVQCGLRQDPTVSLNTSTRTDSPAQYYLEKKDNYSIVEPGYEIGGPILKDKLWLFSSYIPTINRTSRSMNFTGVNPGPHTFYRSYTVHNMFNRLDYQLFNKVRMYAGWQYGYSRVTGQLATIPDSVTGQINAIDGQDPTTFRPDTGSVNPANVFTFGGDWTVNSHAVVTAKYGYFYYDTSDRGKPAGIRYSYQDSLVAPNPGAIPPIVGTTDAFNVPLINSGNSSAATPFIHSAGFANIAPNQQTLFDLFSRKQFSTDFAYTVSKWGTHNFKAGYTLNQLFNNVNIGYNTALVNVFWGDSYTTVTGNPCPAAILTANNNKCRGQWGYFTVQDGINTAGIASSKNHGIFFQDSWTVGHGLTINPGVRFDKEYLPAYAAGYPSVNFGFGAKVAPRIGVAYDLLHNGKIKIYGDYAKFYDIMKFSLPRGSFGGEYWHDCTFTLDTFDLTKITPTAPGGHACGPAPGPAPGVTSGTFIEQKDWRAAVPPSTVDPGLDPNIKPTSTHEFIVGGTWAISPNMELDVRYARKRLDNTIEDMSIDDNVYYIGNPGSQFSNLLHRALPSAGYGVLCSTCPVQPAAIRRYDGLETRLTYHHGTSIFLQGTYTYSKLRGNYSGLTDTDVTDASGGRHNDNNNRSFDIPEMQYTTTGKVTDGPLATDRPNGFTFDGYYSLKWWHHMTTRFGGTQFIEQGTPKSTCVPVYDSTSSCQYWDQRGNFANIHRDPTTGNLVLDSVTTGARTPIFAQTNFNIAHDIGVSKTNEAMKLTFELNVINLLNNDSPLAYNPNPFAGTSEFLTFQVPKTVNAAGVDWPTVMGGYDPIAEGNSENASGKATIVYNNRYGLPFLFQNRRTLRLSMTFTF